MVMRRQDKQIARAVEHWEFAIHEWDLRSVAELRAADSLASPVIATAKPAMGASMATLAAHWSQISASTFNVRDLGYLQHKRKVPSKEALFDLVGGECIISEGPLRQVAARMALPETFPDTPYAAACIGRAVPPLLVINMQIPVHPKAIFGARKPPPTVNAVWYLRVSERTASQLNRLESGHEQEVDGAIRLLHRWCRDAATDDALRGCLKAIGTARNFAEVGAPGLVQGYNSKPILLASSGFHTGERPGIAQFYRKDHFLQIDIDVASHFTYVSQRGICWALGVAEKLVADIAFVIEARHEDELPECVLGCNRLDKMPVLTAMDEASIFGAQEAIEGATGGPTQDLADRADPSLSSSS